MKTIIIEGSSRSNGNTRAATDFLLKNTTWERIDINLLNISSYDYEYRNKDDDYLKTMRRIIVEYDVMIFATPVYWYSMSGKMKTFLDRITDLLHHHKPLGREMEGKAMAALSCSGEKAPNEGFFKPFELTAGYMSMRYLGDCHCNADEGVITEESLKKLQNFITEINGS